MLPIPMFYMTSTTSISQLVCSASVAYPSGISNPSLWYKSNATASTDTSNFNTVNSNSYTRLFGYGTTALHLSSSTTVNFDSFSYSPSNTQNGMPVFGGGETFNIQYDGTNIPASKDRGTFILVWKGNGSESGAKIVIATTHSIPYGIDFYFYPGFFGSPYPAVDILTNATMSNGYEVGWRLATSTLSLDGWNISILSFSASAGQADTESATIKIKNNGQVGSRITGGPISNANGNLYMTGNPGFVGGTPPPISIAEMMWYQTPLTSTQCDSVENYLKQKWCIDY